MQKYVKEVGKRYIAKQTPLISLLAMRTSMDSFGDHHPEVYDYEEECVEPLPIQEHMVGLKVKRRHYATIDLHMLDSDLDLDSSMRMSPLKKRKNSRMSV